MEIFVDEKSPHRIRRFDWSKTRGAIVRARKGKHGEIVEKTS